MATAYCERFPDGEAHIRTTAGIVLFVDGRAEVESPELVEALLAVPDVFGISVDGADIQEADDEEPAPSTPTPGSRPRKNGSEAAWREWAVSHGMDAEAAAELSRDQLIELAHQLDKE